MLRSHTCGELRTTDINKRVELAGWIQSARDHGGIIFIDLRDRYGMTQVVCDPRHNAATHKLAETLKREDVLRVKGKVRFRGKDLINPGLATGEIEVLAQEVEILNRSLVPPIEIDDRKPASEESRLKYRFLDLRRPKMLQNLKYRHKAWKAALNYLDAQDFLHIETPMLMKSTPEGARDYIVPSRVNPGKFYALPQSPQLYKQILMIGGVDRYFQLARCLRDEDLRADRQPEHTQIDLEMSFVEREDIFTIVEGLMHAIWKEVLDTDIKIPFQRLSYKEAMSKYGSDKPDLRFGLELQDVTPIMKKSDFNIYKKVIDEGGVVKALRVPKGDSFSRKEIDNLIEIARVHHAKGLSWMKVEKGKLESNIVKYFPEKVQKELLKILKAKDKDLLLFVADKFKTACDALGQVRLHLGNALDIIDEKQLRFLWVVDFPLFEWDEEEQRWDSMHHMFCAPKKEHIGLIEKDPGSVLCDQYDLTLNGVELCSGSIRISQPALQEKVMKVVGFPKEEAERRFGFLLEALKYGAPPHGGVGLGFDRIVALLCGYTDIREVIAFPKNKQAQNPMDGSPTSVSEQQLKELHLKLDIITPEVTETKVTKFLDSSQLKYTPLPHTKPVFTAKTAAEERSEPISEMVKCMLYGNKNRKFVLCLVPGDKHVDKKRLEKASGINGLRPAGSKEIQDITGYPPGAISPLVLKRNIPIIIDKELTKKSTVNISAGNPMLGLKLRYEDLNKILAGKIADIT